MVLLVVLQSDLGILRCGPVADGTDHVRSEIGAPLPLLLRKAVLQLFDYLFGHMSLRLLRRILAEPEVWREVGSSEPGIEDSLLVAYVPVLLLSCL